MCSAKTVLLLRGSLSCNTLLPRGCVGANCAAWAVEVSSGVRSTVISMGPRATDGVCRPAASIAVQLGQASCKACTTRGIHLGVTVPPFWWVRLLARVLPCSQAHTAVQRWLCATCDGLDLRTSRHKAASGSFHSALEHTLSATCAANLLTVCGRTAMPAAEECEGATAVSFVSIETAAGSCNPTAASKHSVGSRPAGCQWTCGCASGKGG